MSSEYHLNRAVLYRDECRFDEARAEIAAAIFERRGWEDPLRILAGTEFAAGNDSAAFAALEEMLKFHREGAIEAALALARNHSRISNFDAAVHWARTAVSLDPNDAYSRSLLACHLLGIEDYSGAESEAAEAVRLEPDTSVHYVNLACAYEDQGKIEDAINAYVTILNLDPTDENAQEQLTRLRNDE